MNVSRVVIVEDHEMVREMIAGILTEDLGHVVVAQTSSMAEGITLCLQHKPNLVVLDWTLPDGRGFETSTMSSSGSAARAVARSAISPATTKRCLSSRRSRSRSMVNGI